MVKAKATTAAVRDERLAAEQLNQEAQEAQAELTATDWRVIRAVEKWLIEHNELPVQFGVERDALRTDADRLKGNGNGIRPQG